MIPVNFTSQAVMADARGVGCRQGARPKAGLKSVFHKLETYGDQYLQIPVFTGMTGFGAVLRVDKKNDVVNRRALYGPTLERRLMTKRLKPATTTAGLVGSSSIWVAVQCWQRGQ